LGDALLGREDLVVDRRGAVLVDPSFTVLENGTRAMLIELGSELCCEAVFIVVTKFVAAVRRSEILEPPEPRLSAIEPVLSSTMAISRMLLARVTSVEAEICFGAPPDIRARVG
jgi:hypothetical protein